MLTEQQSFIENGGRDSEQRRGWRSRRTHWLQSSHEQSRKARWEFRLLISDLCFRKPFVVNNLNAGLKGGHGMGEQGETV